MLSELRSKYDNVKKENLEKNSVVIWLLFIGRIGDFTWRLISAKFYLRKCEIGKMVTTRGKPLIIAKGNIIVEDWVVLWSVFQRTILSVHANATLRIGSRSRINGAHIVVKSFMSIGKNVRIAPYTLLMDSDFHDIHEHSSEGQSAPITIHDNVWIASRAIILKGVTIGEGSVVAAGSVVTKNVPPYTMVAGTPAKVVKELIRE